jgi:hypothetical protein
MRINRTARVLAIQNYSVYSESGGAKHVAKSRFIIALVDVICKLGSPEHPADADTGSDIMRSFIH